MGKHRIGWIGVGAMGLPMCRNLLAAGYALTVCDRQPARLAEVCRAGAVAADSPRQLAAACDVIFSTVFDDADLRAVALGEDGIVAAKRGRAQTFVDMSTVSPSTSAVVAKALPHRVQYLRAPVSGTVSLAATAQLAVYASGPVGAFERVRPILEFLSARQSYVGLGEEARVLKLLINLLVFTSTAALGEALCLGARAGLDRSTMVDAINDSIAGSAHYRVKAEKLRRRDYVAAGPITLVAKDLDLALQVAARAGAPTPLGALVRQQLLVLQGLGLADLDLAVLAELPELTVGDVDPASLAVPRSCTAPEPLSPGPSEPSTPGA
jgi:3-hydroxyisobutyrate dehydrogenase-like beta-hydroxyacid dehydrogenase